MRGGRGRNPPPRQTWEVPKSPVLIGLKVCLKKSSSILLRKICLIHYLQFSFEKDVLSQVLKDFSVENLETTLSTILSKFSCKICLSPIINYWGSIFTLNQTWGGFCLVCVVPAFFLFLASFFLFLLVFSLKDTNNS